MTQTKQSTDDLLTDLIQVTHANDVSGASMSAVHPTMGGTMMLFYFHPDASEEDMRGLLASELQRTMQALDPDFDEPLPPKDPRNMH